MLWVENRTRPPFYQVCIDLFPYHTFIKHCGVTSEWQAGESSEPCVPIFVLLTVVSAGHCPLHLVCSIPLCDDITINTFLLLMGRFWIFFFSYDQWSYKHQIQVSGMFGTPGTFLLDDMLAWDVLVVGDITTQLSRRYCVSPRWLYNLSLTWKVEAGLQSRSSTHGTVSSPRCVNPAGTPHFCGCFPGN